MTVTYQANVLDTSYNGWENYETWNVALWINNDEGLYHLAMEAGNYEDFVDALEGCSFNDLKTRDGVNYRDPKVNTIQINSDVFDFWSLINTYSCRTEYKLGTLQFTSLFFLIMTLETALGMLRVGNTGADILEILDVIAADIQSEQTINEIEEILFWLTLTAPSVIDTGGQLC